MIKENQKTQLMFDFETLGTSEDAVILSCAAIPYHLEKDAETPLKDFLERAFFFKFNVKDQVERFKRTIDENTLNWWKEQSEGAMKVLAPSEKDGTLEEFYEALKSFNQQAGYDPRNGLAWQRGMIDIIWHDSMMKNLGIELPERPIIWYNVRDIRTAVDCNCPNEKLNGIPEGFFDIFKKIFPEFTMHNPIHDCVKQIHELRMAGVW